MTVSAELTAQAAQIGLELKAAYQVFQQQTFTPQIGLELWRSLMAAGKFLQDTQPVEQVATDVWNALRKDYLFVREALAGLAFSIREDLLKAVHRAEANVASAQEAAAKWAELLDIDPVTGEDMTARKSDGWFKWLGLGFGVAGLWLVFGRRKKAKE